MNRTLSGALTGIVFAVFVFIVINEFVLGQDTSNWSGLQITVVQTLFPLLALIIGFIGTMKLMDRSG